MVVASSSAHKTGNQRVGLNNNILPDSAKYLFFQSRVKSGVDPLIRPFKGPYKAWKISFQAPQALIPPSLGFLALPPLPGALYGPLKGLIRPFKGPFPLLWRFPWRLSWKSAKPH